MFGFLGGVAVEFVERDLIAGAIIHCEHGEDISASGDCRYGTGNGG